MSNLYRLPALLRKYLSELVNVAECVWSCAQNEPLCGKEHALLFDSTHFS